MATDIHDIVEALRSSLGDEVDEVLDGLLAAVDDVNDSESYADGEVDTDDEETTWDSQEVHDIHAAAWQAGFDAARNALSEAIDAAQYRG